MFAWQSATSTLTRLGVKAVKAGNVARGKLANKMDKLIFSLCLCLIYAGALITSRTNWKRDTADFREVMHKIIHSFNGRRNRA